MVYTVVRQAPQYRQLTLEEFLFGGDVSIAERINPNITTTRTYASDEVSYDVLSKLDLPSKIKRLREFNTATEHLREVPRHTLYREFYIPKKSGGLRKIDAPQDELMNALRELKRIFEDDFGALYHTSAFAYIRHRSTIDAVRRHQANESKWFGKYDLSNFFGSTTPEFVMKMFSMVFPFSEVVKAEEGKAELEKALSLAFLDGGLPQGTPISPLITNVMMIPVDYKLFNTLRNYNRQYFVYTRYADDFLVSSRYDFDFRDIENLIRNTLKEFDAPFIIKPEKTRYGSSNGRNWNLGVMLNNKNEITVGSANKHRFEAMLSSYVKDRQKGVAWDIGDIQRMEGIRSYYRMVEGAVIDRIVAHIGQKLGADIPSLIKEDLAR